MHSLRFWLSKLLPWMLAVYWIVLFTATHVPSDQLPSMSLSDKFYHWSAFAVLGFLLSHFLHTRLPHCSLRKLGAITFLVLGIYAVLDENTQRLIPGRTYDNLDLVADWIGAMTGFLSFRLLPKLQGKAYESDSE